MDSPDFLFFLFIVVVIFVIVVFNVVKSSSQSPDNMPPGDLPDSDNLIKKDSSKKIIGEAEFLSLINNVVLERYIEDGYTKTRSINTSKGILQFSVLSELTI